MITPHEREPAKLLHQTTTTLLEFCSKTPSTHSDPTVDHPNPLPATTLPTSYPTSPTAPPHTWTQQI